MTLREPTITDVVIAWVVIVAGGAAVIMGLLYFVGWLLGLA